MFYKNTTTLNLDISDYSLKACKLVKKRDGIYIDGISQVSVPNDYIKKGRIVKESEVAKLIHDVLEKAQHGRIKQRLINTVLPDTTTFVKLIEVPSTDTILSTDEVYKELIHHIPYEIEEVYIDWQIVGANKDKNTKFVLIGACPRDIVNQYSNLVHECGFIPQSLEIEALPITRCIFKPYNNKEPYQSKRHVIVMDIGDARSNLIFWKEENDTNIIEFSVSIPLSGRKINDIIKDMLQLTDSQVEQFKKRCGLKTDEICQGVLLKLLQPLLQKFISRVVQAIDFHKTHFNDGDIDKILLCGGGANLLELDKYLEDALHISVEIADPIINIKNKDILKLEDAQSFCTAIGLGLKELI